MLDSAPRLADAVQATLAFGSFHRNQYYQVAVTMYEEGQRISCFRGIACACFWDRPGTAISREPWPYPYSMQVMCRSNLGLCAGAIHTTTPRMLLM